MYKMDVLLKQNRHLFHTRDLALLWNITNDNTLYTTIKRYKSKGILFAVQKGFYSTIPIDKISPLELGSAYIHSYKYISCEYVLTKNGIIFQDSSYITFISSKSLKFEIGQNHYWSRKLEDSYLYNDLGIQKKDNIYMASIERAVADILYFNPKQFIDNQTLNWDAINKIRKEIGYT